MNPAYFYVRWSSDEQTSGDSEKRQRQALQAYATRHGFSTIDTIIDAGVSAFRGDNVRLGRLGKLITAVEKGKRPAHPLLVENQDRLTRLPVDEALELIRRINKAGMELHIADSGKIYGKGKTDLGAEVTKLVDAHMNNGKSDRAKDFSDSWWRDVVKEIKEGECMNARLPAWLTAPKRGKHGPAQTIRVDETRVRLIKRLFKMSLKGAGCQKIAVTLDREGIPPWSGVKTWSEAYINKLLGDRRLLGEHQRTTLDDNGRRVKAELLANYYPPVLDSGLFARVQILRAAIHKAHCGKSGTSKGRKESPNIFAGLLVDGETGCSYTLRLDVKVNREGKRKTYPKLICRLPGGDYHKIPFVNFRDKLLNIILAEDWQFIFSVQATEDLTSSVESAKAELDAARTQREFLLEARSDKSLTNSERSTVVKDYLSSVKRESVAAAQLDALKERLGAFEHAAAPLIQAPTLSELKAKIAELVKRIEITPGTERWELYDEDVPGHRVKIYYRSGAVRDAFVSHQ